MGACMEECIKAKSRAPALLLSSTSGLSSRPKPFCRAVQGSIAGHTHPRSHKVPWGPCHDELTDRFKFSRATLMHTVCWTWAEAACEALPLVTWCAPPPYPPCGRGF